MKTIVFAHFINDNFASLTHQLFIKFNFKENTSNRLIYNQEINFLQGDKEEFIKTCDFFAQDLFTLDMDALCTLINVRKKLIFCDTRALPSCVWLLLICKNLK